MARVRSRSLLHKLAWLAYAPVFAAAFVFAILGARSLHFTFLAVAEGGTNEPPEDDGLTMLGVAAVLAVLGVLLQRFTRSRLLKDEPPPDLSKRSWFRKHPIPILIVGGLFVALIAMPIVYGWPRGAPDELDEKEMRELKEGRGFYQYQGDVNNAKQRLEYASRERTNEIEKLKPLQEQDGKYWKECAEFATELANWLDKYADAVSDAKRRTEARALQHAILTAAGWYRLESTALLTDGVRQIVPPVEVRVEGELQASLLYPIVPGDFIPRDFVRAANRYIEYLPAAVQNTARKELTDLGDSREALSRKARAVDGFSRQSTPTRSTKTYAAENLASAEKQVADATAKMAEEEARRNHLKILDENGTMWPRWIATVGVQDVYGRVWNLLRLAFVAGVVLFLRYVPMPRLRRLQWARIAYVCSVTFFYGMAVLCFSGSSWWIFQGIVMTLIGTTIAVVPFFAPKGSFTSKP